jgi:hypothetical protein
MKTLSTGMMVCLVVLLAAQIARGGENEGKPARESLNYISLSDGKEFSVRIMVRARERPESTEVKAALDPKGAANYLGETIWETPLVTLDYTPGSPYYVLVKETKEQIFVFLLWNGRHFTINKDTGKIVKQGTGEDALLTYNDLVPLKLVIRLPQTTMNMSEKDEKVFKVLNELSERIGSQDLKESELKELLKQFESNRKAQPKDGQ